MSESNNRAGKFNFENSTWLSVIFAQEASSSKPRKRPTETQDSIMPGQKVAKSTSPYFECSSYLQLHPVHPFFAKPAQGKAPFNWNAPLGPNRSCLQGVNLKPINSTKVAAFDLDGTIIKSNRYTAKQKADLVWEWWKPCVPSKLKEVEEAGYVCYPPIYRAHSY
jgi:hypothetical protein